MNTTEALSEKVRIQGTINICLGVLLMFAIIIVSIIVEIDLLLTLVQVVLGVECFIAGLIAGRAVKYPSAFTASRYSRIQFINWIIWIVLGGLSAYLEIVITSISKPSSGVVVIVVISALGFYFAGCYIFYRFVLIARLFSASFIGQYQRLNEGANREFANQVAYPGQGFPGQVLLPGQAYPGNPGQGVYMGQPVPPRENLEFNGEAHVISDSK